MVSAARKVVTVLFCDVVEFTTLGEELDPERLRRVMSRFFDEMEAVLERHGGTVEKFIGDEIMAVFGVPTAHEDDALRAVRAAAEMMRRLEALNDELERSWGVRIEIRVGVNTGEVVVGDHSRGHGFVTGDAVNVAKRLETAADPGEILLGKATYPLVRHAVQAGPLQSFTVKGKADLVSSVSLHDVVPAAPALARRFDTPLVGRAGELRVLRDAHERALATGACELVTIVGGAGIGKSRLVGEFLRSVEESVVALHGRCLPYGDGITFWPLVEILQQVRGLAAATDGSAGHARALAERLQEQIAGSATGASEDIMWTARKTVETLAHDRSAVVCFEDIHWAEPALLDLIEYLAGWVRDAPVLLVCLTRPDLFDTRPSWVAPRTNAAVIPLEPLGRADAGALLDALARDGLDDAARKRVADAAEGNPLFVEQMVAMLAEEPTSGDAIPPTIQALLAARLDRLAPAEREVLASAAVCGRQFWYGGVAGLVSGDVRRDLPLHLMALVRKGFIRPGRDERRRGDDTFVFTHGLVRDAAYEALSKEARAGLHERFARWLEQNVGERARELEEIIGYHFEQAYRARTDLAPVDERARELAWRAAELLGAAGRRAFGRDDMTAALKLLDRAVALASDEDPARLELMRELSNALWATGEIARAESLLNGLVEAASIAGDRRIEWYALLERAARADHVEEHAELLELAEEALRVFHDLGDDDGLAAAWRRIAAAHEVHNRYRLAQHACEEGLAAARRAGNRKEEARIVDRLCTCLLGGPEPAAAAIDRCEEILRRADGNRLFEANVLVPLAGLLAMTGDFERARTLYADGDTIYRDLGLVLPSAGSTFIAADIEFLAGDAIAAERHLRQGYDVFTGAGLSRLLSFQSAYLAEALRAQGRLAEAEQLADAAAGSASPQDLMTHVLWRTVRSRLHAEQRQAARAIEVAEQAVRLAERAEAPALHAGTLLALAEALAADAQHEHAAAAASRANDVFADKGHAVGEARASRLVAELAVRV